MSLQEVLRHLSEPSGWNEDLLSSRERELLTNILGQVKNCGEGPGVTRCAEGILARAVGETLQQRATEVIGRSVLEEIGRSRFRKPVPS